ncbi:MAG: hypothetical protein ACLT76_06480 [Clostridium fessum]
MCGTKYPFTIAHFTVDPSYGDVGVRPAKDGPFQERDIWTICHPR